MLNRANLELLKDAALRGDWKGTADAYLEVVLQLKESGEQRDLSALDWALRLQNGAGVAAIVGEWLRGGQRDFRNQPSESPLDAAREPLR
jgi:hypothetical protein